MKQRLVAILLLVSTSFAFSQPPEGKEKEYRAGGVVTYLQQLCLKTYTNLDKTEEWMRQNENVENPSASADQYRSEPSDHVFLIGNEHAQFVASLSEVNMCSIYGIKVDRATVEALLTQLMNELADKLGTSFKVAQENKKNNLSEKLYVAMVPRSDQPLIGFSLSVWETKDENNSLVKISVSSLMRMEAYNNKHPRKAKKSKADEKSDKKTKEKSKDKSEEKP